MHLYVLSVLNASPDFITLGQSGHLHFALLLFALHFARKPNGLSCTGVLAT